VDGTTTAATFSNYSTSYLFQPMAGFRLYPTISETQCPSIGASVPAN